MSEPAVLITKGPAFPPMQDAQTPLFDRLAAATTLTQQLDALGSSKGYRTPEAAAGDVLTGLWLLGCPTAGALHKGAGNMVAAVHGKNPALCAQAIPAWYEWMLTRAAAAETGALETVASVLTEMPLIRGVVTGHIAAGGGASFAACSELVSGFARTLSGYHGEDAAPSAMPPGLHGACEDATSALKLAATVLADRAALGHLLATRRDVAEALLRSSLSLLSVASMLPKEALTQVGLVLGRLVFREGGEAGDAEALYRFLVELVGGATELHVPVEANDLLAAPVLDWPAWWRALSSTGQLGLVRGLLITSPRARADKSAASKKGAALGPSALAFLVDTVPSILLRGLEDPQDLDRMFALHVLETWLAMLTRLGGSRGGGANSIALPEALTRQLSKVILANWEHRNRRISSLQPRLLDSLLELQAAGGAAAASTAAVASSSLVDSLLSSPTDYHPRYAALVQAIPRVGAAAVLARRPDTPAVLLAAVQALAGSPTPGTAHTAFFTQLRRDMEAAYGLPLGVCGGATGWWRRSGDAPGAAAGARMRELRAALAATPLRALLTPTIAAAAHMAAAGVAGPLLHKDDFDAAFPWASAAAAAAAAPLPAQPGAAPCADHWWAPWWAAWWALSKADPLLACLYGAGGAASVSAPLDLAAFAAAAAAVKAHLTAAVHHLAAEGALPAGDAPAAVLELLHADIYARWLAAWCPAALACSVEPVRARRARAVQQGVADLVLLDHPTHELVGKLLAVAGPTAAATAVGDDGSSLGERRAWARMQVARMAIVANQRDVFVQPGRSGALLSLDGYFTAPWLPFAEALCGVFQADPDGRLSTVEVVAASIGAGSAVTKHRLPGAPEYDLFLAWLSSCLKCATPDFLRRGIRIFQAFITKCLDLLTALHRDLRLATADAAAAAAAEVAGGAGAAPVAPHKTQAGQRGRRAAAEWVASLYALQEDSACAAGWGDAAVSPAEPRVTLAMCAAVEAQAAAAEAAFTAFIHSAASAVARCLYPRAPFDRLLLPLELAKVLVDVVGFPAAAHEPADTPALRIRRTALAPMLTVQFSTELVNTLVSSWERARECAFYLVAGLPQPLPGYDVPAVAGLLTWGLALTASTRQREYEGGATIIRMVHSQFVVKYGWDIAIAPGVNTPAVITLPPAGQDAATTAATAPARSLRFITSVLDAMDRRCDAFRVTLQDVFGHVHAIDELAAPATSGPSNEFPQPHGALMAARFVLEDLPLAKLGAEEAAAAGAGAAPLGWRALVVRLSAAARHALSVAMQVVAGTGDSDGVKVGGGDAEGGEGEDATASAALGGGGEEDDNEEMEVAGPVSVGGPCNDAATTKRGALVIGAWLTTREACLTLSGLVDKCPLPATAPGAACSTEADEAGPAGGGWLLSCEGVRSAANALLEALLALKHIGCIAMAGEALRIVSARLLLHGHRHLGLAALPEAWLRGLFVRMGQAVQFILRRSAGFAQSFLSIIRSEPRVHGVPLVLLDLAATELLRHTGMVRRGGAAAGDEWELLPNTFSWRSHVHALNTLRLFFREATFAESMTRFISPAIRTAVAGFTSKAWAVRNSSMMLFAVASDRALGSDARNLKEGAKSSTTTSQFFTRFPSLFPFLLTQMREACAAEQGQDSPLLHPVLFPIMLLLSRMSPEVKSLSDTAAAPAASYDMEPTFVPLLSHCLGEKHTFIRRMAARALVALLPPATALPLVAAALEKALPPTLEAATRVGACDWNLAHGTLLAARATVAATLLQCKGWLSAGVGVAAALGPLVTALSARPWVVASSRVPAFVRAVALEALEGLDECLAITTGSDMAAAAKAFRRSLLQAASACLVAAEHPSLTPIDSGYGGLLVGAARVTATHAARAAFAVASGAAAAPCRDAGLTALQSLLSAPSHEVRTGAAKKVKAVLKHARTLLAGEAAPLVAVGETEEDAAGASRYLAQLLGRDAPLASRLGGLLLSALATERYPDASRALAHALQLLTAAQPAALDAAAPATWSAALLAYHSSTDALARAHLLRVVGRLVAAAATGSQHLAGFVGLVAAAAQDAASYRLRLAAQQALGDAGLLLPATLTAATAAQDTCAAAAAAVQVVLTGLQDHDDEVRDGARAVVQTAVIAANANRSCKVADALRAVLTRYDQVQAGLAPAAAADMLPLPSGAALHTVVTTEGAAALCDTVGIPLTLAYVVAVAEAAGAPALAQQVLQTAAPAAAGREPSPAHPVTPTTYLFRPLFIAEEENCYAEARVLREAAAVLEAVRAGAPAARLTARKAVAAHFVPVGVVRDEWVCFGGARYD